MTGAPQAVPPALRLALGDAIEAQGALRATAGGATARVPGARLMASGLPQGQWNTAHLDDPTVVDMTAVAAWYAGRGVGAWGVQVSAGSGFAWGRRIVTQDLMVRPAVPLPAAPAPAGVTVRAAAAADLDAVVAVDARAFDEAPAASHGWLAPLFAWPQATVALAEVDGRVVGCGYVLATDGLAGAAAVMGGVAVDPAARRRGVGGAVSHWLTGAAVGAGAGLVHLHAATEDAARIYRRLGYADAGQLDIHVP